MNGKRNGNGAGPPPPGMDPRQILVNELRAQLGIPLALLNSQAFEIQFERCMCGCPFACRVVLTSRMHLGATGIEWQKGPPAAPALALVPNPEPVKE
jgi:hypothetical protein